MSFKTAIYGGILVSAGAMLLGCGVSTSVARLADEKFEPKPSEAPIEVLTSKPGKPHLVLAKLTSSHQRYAQALFPTDGSACIEDMKAEARGIGADAILIIEMYTAPTGTVGAGGSTVQAYAIRWK